MTFILCVLLWLVCIGIACWADLNAQKHIAKGFEDAWKQAHSIGEKK